MENNAITDAGAGKGQLFSKFKFMFDALHLCTWVSFIVFVIPIAGWIYFSNPQSYDMVKLDLLTKVSDSTKPKIWRIRGEDGKRGIVTATLSDGKYIQTLNPTQVKIALKDAYQPVYQFYAFLLITVFCSGLAFFLMYFYLKKTGRESMENQWLRGAEPIISSNKLKQMVRKLGASAYTLITIPLPKTALTTGILVSGTQGSGKSLAIHDLMTQVFNKKKKAVIYDPTGEFYRAYFRPGKDFFFNPAFEGSVPWSIFSELRYSYDADTLAQAFLPPKPTNQSGPNGFFEDAARALFSVILLRLTKMGSVNTSDIADAFLNLPEEEMKHLVKNSIANSSMDSKAQGMRAGVISSIAIYLNGIASVGKGGWSITDFLNADEDARFFIYGTDDTKAMFTPLYRLLIAISFAMIASKQEVVHGEAKYWFFLDEIHTLGDIKLDEHLATLRKFGVAIVAGIQSESQLTTSMGEGRADTAMNCFNTLLQLRANETGMAEKASKRLGKAQYIAVATNMALGVTKVRDGVGVSSSKEKDDIVMDSEIMKLPDCQGYIKLPGSFPVAKIDYSGWLKKSVFGIFGAKYIDRFAEVLSSPKRDNSFVVDNKRFIDAVQNYDMREVIKTEMASDPVKTEQNLPLLADLPPIEAYANDSSDSSGKLFFRE